MYVFRPELTNPEDLRSLRVGLLYYVVELVLGLCLLFGATGDVLAVESTAAEEHLGEAQVIGGR